MSQGDFTLDISLDGEGLDIEELHSHNFSDANLEQINSLIDQMEDTPQEENGEIEPPRIYTNAELKNVKGPHDFKEN